MIKSHQPIGFPDFWWLLHLRNSSVTELRRWWWAERPTSPLPGPGWEWGHPMRSPSADDMGIDRSACWNVLDIDIYILYIYIYIYIYIDIYIYMHIDIYIYILLIFDWGEAMSPYDTRHIKIYQTYLNRDRSTSSTLPLPGRPWTGGPAAAQ